MFDGEIADAEHTDGPLALHDRQPAERPTAHQLDQVRLPVGGRPETGRPRREEVHRADITAVVRRPDTCTGLIVDVVEPGGRWRYLEHLPPEVLVSAPDVHAAAVLSTAAHLTRT